MNNDLAIRPMKGAKDNTPHASQSKGLMSLPRELRQEIMKYLFAANSMDDGSVIVALMDVCKDVRGDAVGVVFCKTFTFFLEQRKDTQSEQTGGPIDLRNVRCLTGIEDGKQNPHPYELVQHLHIDLLLRTKLEYQIRLPRHVIVANCLRDLIFGSIPGLPVRLRQVPPRCDFGNLHVLTSLRFSSLKTLMIHMHGAADLFTCDGRYHDVWHLVVTELPTLCTVISQAFRAQTKRQYKSAAYETRHGYGKHLEKEKKNQKALVALKYACRYCLGLQFLRLQRLAKTIEIIGANRETEDYIRKLLEKQKSEVEDPEWEDIQG